MDYNYDGKLWRQSGTVSDKNSFFHSAFGVRADGDDLYLDKLAKLRRMHWATFLTHLESEVMSPPLAETLKQCLSASDKYKSVLAENRIPLDDYMSDIIKAERDVTIEELPIVAALENIKIIVFVDGARDPVTIVNPDLELLGNYTTNNEFKGEVVLSLEGNVFSRMDPVDEDPVSKFVKDKVPEVEGVKKDAKQLTPGLIGYKKGGSAGSKGVKFQVGLLTIFFLNALEKLENWMLSTENKMAGKFDDVVLECPEGDTLLQAKHKQIKTKRITFEDLMSTNSKNDDFSLPKYFLSYEEIKNKFKLKNVIICTNASVDWKTMNKFLNAHKVSPKSMLYYQNCDCKFYTFTDDIIPYLRENARSYFEKNWQNKGMNESAITDENIKEFLEHFQLYSSYPPGNDIGKIIDQMLLHMNLSGNRYGQASSLEIRKKISDWFEQTKGQCLTELYAKAVFAEIRRDRHWQRLERYNVLFENNNLIFKNSNRMFHVVVEGGHFLQEMQIFHAWQHDKTKILFVNPSDGTEAQKQAIEAFQLPEYVILVLIWPRITKDLVMQEAGSRLRQILDEYDYKKVILVADYNNKIPHRIQLSKNNYEVVTEHVKFEDLSQDTRERLIKKENVIFQGNKISLEQLLATQAFEDYGNFLNSEILETLLQNKKINVGVACSGLSDDIIPVYMKRKLKIARNEGGQTTKPEVLLPEDDIYRVTEKVVLISDSAGMGKSTVLTSLAVTIKKNHPYLWVIRVDLNNYTEILMQFLQNNKKTITVKELLDSKHSTKLTNHLERSTFSMNGKVLLMLDGFDEISPDYTELIVNLLRECQEAPNYAKIFVTTRPHVSRELESELQVKSFILDPFTRQDQIDFLVNYWRYNLSLVDSERHKCERYAKSLIHKVLHWIEGYKQKDKNFAAVPLQVRMLAEIFQENDRFEDPPEWQQCKEFLASDEDEPRLPHNMDLARLYHMFIEKKRKIFMDKGKSTGNTIMNRALIDQFQECLAYQRTLSLELILGKERCLLFSCYQQGHGNVTVNTLKIGIVQKLNKIRFIHRTFAEYFVAQAILQELQTQNGDVKFQKLFVEEILVDSQFQVVRVFLDGFLKLAFDDLPCRNFETYQSVAYEINSNYYDKPNFLHTLAREGHVSLFRLILKCMDTLEEIPVTNKIIRGRRFGNVLNVLLARIQCEGLDVSVGQKTLLEHAVETNQFEMVKILVQMGADVNVGSHKPLHLATYGSHFKVLKFLVENGADITSRDVHNTGVLYKAVNNCNSTITTYLLDRMMAGPNPDDSLALYVASRLGRLDIVETLLERGVGIDSRIGYGETPFFGAVRGAQYETMRYLAQQGCDINVRELWIQSARQSINRTALPVPITKRLIESGLDVNAISSTEGTTLHSAIKWDYLDAIKLLVSSGANVNLRDGRGATPLHIAASNLRKDTVRFLLSHGADIDVRDNYGQTPLHVAIRDKNSFNTDTVFIGYRIEIKGNEGPTAPYSSMRNDSKVVECLVQAGADIAMTDNVGETALHFLAKNPANANDIINHLAIANVLVSHCGEAVNIKDGRGRTALHWAASVGDLRLVEILALHNADVNITDGHGQTALHLAVAHPETLQLLVKHGADVGIRDDRGRTVIHLAAGTGDLNTVRFLAEMGADIDVKDDEDSTPLQLALSSCHSGVFMYLVKIGADPTLIYDKISAHLHSAVKRGSLEDVAFFLGSVDINRRDDNGDSILHSAVHQQNLLMVEFLVDSGIDVNLKGRMGCTALHWAASIGNSKLTELLVTNNADVNLRDDDGQTALHLAVTDPTIVQFLVKHGANLGIRDDRGRTVIHLAAENDDLRTVRFLAEMGVDIDVKDDEDSTPLQLALDSCCSSVFKHLIEIGADTTLRYDKVSAQLVSAIKVGRFDNIAFLLKYVDINGRDDNGASMLHSAVHKLQPNPNIVKFLIDSGIDVRLKDPEGRTALHWAASMDHMELIKLLVTNNADVNVTDSHGQTALHLSAGHPETVQFLVKHGANLGIRDDRGRTVIHLAAENDDLRTVRFLAKMGVDIDVTDDEDSTPLQLALDNCCSRVFKHLRKIGADTTLRYDRVSFQKFIRINERDDDGDSMLHSAVRQANLHTIKFLVDSGIDVDLKDRTGRTALHLACERRLYDIVDFLIHGGANVDARDNEGATPLHVAAERDLELVKTLVKRGAYIYVEDLKGDTPAILAKKKKHLNIFTYLQERLRWFALK